MRSSGGDEVISDEGDGFGTAGGAGLAAPARTPDEFRTALEQARDRRQGELAQVAEASPTHRRLRAELIAIERKLRNLDLAFLAQRNAFVLVQGSLTAFVYQHAPERQWEINYATRAGDTGLAASIVQDVLARFETPGSVPVDHVAVAQGEDAADELTGERVGDAASVRLKAESEGADALLKLALLAIEAADFGEAEKQLRACIQYESDLTVRAEALSSYSALLGLLDRDEEARRIDALAERTLNLSR